MSSGVEAELVAYLESRDAFWRWANHRHVALLASGKLSNFFANLSPLYENVGLQDAVGFALVLKFFERPRSVKGNVWVIGPSIGAVGLVQSIARALTARFVSAQFSPGYARCGYTEKVLMQVVSTDLNKLLIEHLELKRFDLGPSPQVILVEDVVTTAGSMEETKKALPTGSVVVGRMAVVDRRVENLDLEIVSVLRVSPRTWDSVDQLPVEMRGCVPIRPKGNWKALTTEFLAEKA